MYTIIEDMYNGWYGVVDDSGKLVTLASSNESAEQFIESKISRG